jgi:transcriptional regulator with XRE-family HTH domain
VDGLRLGRQFRALRIRLRVRQKDVAQEAGVSRSLVAAVDRGELDGVTIGSLRGLTEALGAHLDLFLRWRGERLDRLLAIADQAPGSRSWVRSSWLSLGNQ